MILCFFASFFFFLTFFLSFSNQPVVTTADLTPGLLSFLFSFDAASYKSYDSAFFFFALIFLSLKTSEISPSVLSFFLSFHVNLLLRLLTWPLVCFLFFPLSMRQATNHMIQPLFLFCFNFSFFKDVRDLTIRSFFLSFFLSTSTCFYDCWLDPWSAFFSFLFRCGKLQIIWFSLCFFFALIFLSLKTSEISPSVFSFFLSFFLSFFPRQLAFTTADLTPGLLSFLSSFDAASYKSYDSAFVSFLL